MHLKKKKEKEKAHKQTEGKANRNKQPPLSLLPWRRPPPPAPPFKSQLLLKTSGNPRRFPNVQHKLRYTFQFLTGKTEQTTRIHLQKTVEDNGEENYEVLFGTSAAFLTALD